MSEYYCCSSLSFEAPAEVVDIGSNVEFSIKKQASLESREITLVEWFVNGEKVAQDVDSINLSATELGVQSIEVVVTDSADLTAKVTHAVKIEPKLVRTFSRPYDVEISFDGERQLRALYSQQMLALNLIFYVRLNEVKKDHGSLLSLITILLNMPKVHR